MTAVHPLTTFRLQHSPPLSQRDLAGMLGVARETIWRWETGGRMPDPAMVPKISKTTGIPAHELRPDLAEKLGMAS